MPVTTRSAALRSQTKKDKVDPEASSNRKKPSSRQRKRQEKQPSSDTCISSEACHRLYSSSSKLEMKTLSLAVHRQDIEREDCTNEVDFSMGHLFPNQELVSPSPAVFSAEIASTEVEELVPLSAASSSLDNDDGNDLSQGDSDAPSNVPVVSGDITFGTSTRGGRMIFMNFYGYIFMNETKEFIGWRCIKRNEQCKAVIYTCKNTA